MGNSASSAEKVETPRPAKPEGQFPPTAMVFAAGLPVGVELGIDAVDAADRASWCGLNARAAEFVPTVN